MDIFTGSWSALIGCGDECGARPPEGAPELVGIAAYLCEQESSLQRGHDCIAQLSRGHVVAQIAALLHGGESGHQGLLPAVEGGGEDSPRWFVTFGELTDQRTDGTPTDRAAGNGGRDFPGEPTVDARQAVQRRHRG